MNSRGSDWHLLFGLFALQNGAIDRDQLVTAFGRWIGDKSQSLDRLLVEAGAISEMLRLALVAMVEHLVQRHGGDIQQSLGQMGGCDLASAQQALDALRDPDLQASCVLLPVMDRLSMESLGVGQWTSGGQRFRIVRPLPGGRGGMGVIAVACDEELGRDVALKQIQPEKVDQPAYRQKFQLEAEITGNLEHPGIVPVYGLGSDTEGRPFYAMRLVKGEHLGHAIRTFHEALKSGRQRYGDVEFLSLIDRLIDVCQAIRYAHSRGVLHRDLKPANILVGRYGETLVIDWGLARLHSEKSLPVDPEEPLSDRATRPLQVRSGSDAAPTMPGSFIGTPGYASPEQTQGQVERLDQRSDVYSLGAILYHILTGRAPTDRPGVSLEELLDDTIHGRIVVPHRVQSALPRGLSAIAMKALALDPANRYQTVGKLIEELERWKADEPLSALPETVGPRVGRWLRHHRGVAATIAIAMLVVTCLSIATALVVNYYRAANADLARNNASIAQLERAAREETETQRLEVDRQRVEAEKQAQRAEDQATLTERERQRLAKALDFFVSVFRSPDPTVDGRHLKVAELLMEAEKRIHDQLAQDPYTLATLLTALSQTYQGLGMYQESVPLAQKAVSLRTAGLGRDHPDTLASLNDLGKGYWYSGQYDEAVEIHTETLALRRLRLGEGHPDTWTSLGNLALAHQSRGDLRQAIQLFEEARLLADAHPNIQDPERLVQLGNLAVAYQEAGQLERSLEMMQELLGLGEGTYDVDHPELLATCNNLAVGYLTIGKVDLALPLIRETSELSRSRLGEDHPVTLTAQHNLGMCYVALQQFDIGLPLLKENAQKRERILKLDHPDTLTSKNVLAGVYAKTDKWDLALPLWEDVLQLRRDLLGENHPSTLTTMNNLGWGYYKVGKYDLAMALLVESRQRTEETLGIDHPGILTTLDTLASVHWAMGEREPACALAQKAALGVEQRQFQHDRAGPIIANLINFLEQMGRDAEAESWRRKLSEFVPDRRGD